MDWITIITTVGFPIACCIALAFYVQKITESNRNDVKELNLHHNQEMLEFKTELMETINKNTQAIMKLSEKIDKIGGDKNEA